MKLRVRPIGNSKGIIIPAPALYCLGTEELEFTLIGDSAVLTRAHGHGPDQDEVLAALAYASVKANRAALLEHLNSDDGDAAG